MQKEATGTACRGHTHIFPQFHPPRTVTLPFIAEDISVRESIQSGRAKALNQAKKEANRSGESDQESKLRTKTVHLH